MSEYVLAIPRTELTKQGVGTDGIYPFDICKVDPHAFAFLPRHVVDDKSVTSIEIGKLLPQILGYFQVTDTEGRILTYRRKGKEKGLLGKYSIGIGGHVDLTDYVMGYKDQNDQLSIGLLDSIVGIIENGAKRELSEEITLDLFGELVFDKMISSYADPTSIVHVALIKELVVNDVSSLNYSEEEFNAVQWLTKQELKELHEHSGDVEFETWSKLIIEAF